MNYKATKLFVKDFRAASPAEIRERLDPVYKKFGVTRLVNELDCNLETLRKYRSKTNPRKPSFEHYLLLRALLEENKLT